MGSGPKPAEGVKLREAVARRDGTPGAHGSSAQSGAHAGGQAPVPRSMSRSAKPEAHHYDSPTSSLTNPSGGRVPSANAAHEAAGGQRSASSSSAAAAPHDAVPGGKSHYTAAPTRGAHGETAPRVEVAGSSTSGQAQSGGGQSRSQYDNLRGVELSPPSRQPGNAIEMRNLRSQTTTGEANYGETSFANTATSHYNNNGLNTGSNAAPAGYTAPPAGGGAGTPAVGQHAQPTQAGGLVGAPGGGVAVPVANPVYHAPPIVAAQQPVATRFERFKAAVKRNPKKSIGIPVVIAIAGVVGGVLGGLRPWEAAGVPPVGDDDNSMPPIPTAKPGNQKLTSGASLADADLKSLVVPGSDESGFEIDPASFSLYLSAMNAEGKTIIETDDGTWTVSTSGESASAIGLLSFVPKATFAGGAAEVHFSVKDKKGTESNRATFTVQYGPKLHDAVLNDQDPKAKSVSFTVTNWNEAAKTGAFEPHDMKAESALDPGSILFFDAALNSDKPSLDVAGAGSWSAANGVITFTPLAGLMAQMVFVTYSVKDKSGSVSNRASLTIAFKPEGMVVDPGNKDMTRKPVISSNIQIVVSGRPVTVPISSDINLKPDSLRIVSGTARVTNLPVSGKGTWTSAGNQLTFTPEPGYRGAPAPVSVTARSAFDVESDPFILTLMIFALPVVTDDFVSSTYPAIIKPLNNDKVGYTMENNVLVPSSVEIFAVISSTTGPVVATDRKSANVPMEGTWTVNADGSVTFQPVTGFVGGPKPISYTVADSKGSRSDPAVITLNRQVGDIATRFAAMMSMTQGEFFQNYVTALSDPAKKYSMFDVLDATNQLMLIFITEAQRVNQYATVQMARQKTVATGSSVTIIDAETDKAMMLWMARNFTIQGLVDATDSIRDTLIGIPIRTAPIGIRAVRLEVMADLIERYISTMMLVRAKSMT